MHGYDPQFQSLLSARDAAFDEKQRLYQPMEDAFQETVRLKAKDPRIDSLFDQAQREHEQGRRAAEASQAAFHNRTGQAGAYSQQKQQHYATRDSLQAEAKALIARVKADRDAAHNHWDSARQRFIAARDTYNTARDAFNAYRSVHRYISHPGDAELAAQAGVPVEFHGHLYVSMDEKGNRQIYYGGENGDPLGAGHGHYVLDKYGNVTYRRPPQAEHGVQNVVGYQPPAKKQAAKPATRSAAKPADQQAARAREETRRREEARLAQERLDQAKEEERRRLDAPRIAAQAAAAQAAERAAQARLERAIRQAAADGLMQPESYYRDPTNPIDRDARHMHIRVEKILADWQKADEEAARNRPVVTPPEPIRPTPPVAPRVQPPAQPTPTTQPAKAGTGRKREATERAAIAEGHGPAKDNRHRHNRANKPIHVPTTRKEHARRVAAYEQWRDSGTLPDNMWMDGSTTWDRDLGEEVINVFIGFKGERDERKKMHITLTKAGDIQFVRYLDGEALYDRKAGIGSLKDLGLE